MTALVLLVCLMLGGARALVDLDCSDNATCIEEMGRTLVKSLREQKSVRLFELLTIEPLERRQGRSSKGLWGLVENHALSFDWSDFTFRFTLPKDGRDDALDLEMYENRSVKEETDPSPKKSSSKVEEEKEEDKTPKMGLHHGIRRRRRRQKKKVLQALIPLLFGMKSAGVVLFAFAIVATLTMKAFVASKTALLVTIGMALKRLYDTYSTGVGLQNHPYLYSQYPIDFPSASSHAYSVSGVSPQFASNEMYNPNIMGQQELLQQDANPQPSQQAPLLLNSTHAAERWDGKSKFQKLLEPIVDGFKNVISPIANIFYGAMPTFRGLNTEVSTDKTVETEAVEEVKPKEFLVPQPRFIAQRKNFVKMRTRPKKYAELKVDLDRLKRNKDFQDYIKTKKYKYNYPNTYYYPRVKYVLYNPNNFYSKPNNSRLQPYLRTSTVTTTPLTEPSTLLNEASDWKPIVVRNITAVQNMSTLSPKNNVNFSSKNTNKFKRRFFRKGLNLKRRKRVKRDVYFYTPEERFRSDKGRGFLSMFDFITDFFTSEPVYNMLYEADHITKTTLKDNIVPENKPPLYYTAVYDVVMMTLDVVGGVIDVMEGVFGVQKDINQYYFDDNNAIKKKKIKRKQSNTEHDLKLESNETKSDLEQNNTLTNITKPFKIKVGTKKKKLLNKKKKINNRININITNVTETENVTTEIIETVKK